jgi:hypothetical protein
VGHHAVVALNLENTEPLNLFLNLSVYPGQPEETLKTSQTAIVAFWPERSEQKSGREELKKLHHAVLSAPCQATEGPLLPH